MADRFEKYRVSDGGDNFSQYKTNEISENNEKSMPDESFLSKLPRNIIAGLASLGHSTINMPHDIVKFAENFGSGVGKYINPEPTEEWKKLIAAGPQPTKLSKYIPHQEEKDFAGMLGQKGKGTLMDNLIQGAVEHSPEIASLPGLLKEAWMHLPITQTGAARKLREAEQLINNMGIKIPLESKFIKESKQFLPKTTASKSMLEKASAGEYGSTFGLQSQIGKHERDLRKSTLAAERLLSPQARELKESILGQLENGLRVQGQHKIADLLKGGLSDYKQYIKFRDEIKPLIGKIAIPSTALGILGLGYNKGKKFIEK